jgi:hypothetical protein
MSEAGLESGCALAAQSPWSAVALLDVLERSFHSAKNEWLFLRELRIGTGRTSTSMQRLDAFALNSLPHLGMRRICYEVKISRADFLGEVKRPLKRRIGMRFSNEFYFVTPAGLLAPAEIPVDCGLVEIGIATAVEWNAMVQQCEQFVWFDPPSSTYCTTTVPACWRDTPGPTWQFTAAMLRNQRREFEDRPPAPPKQTKLDLTL